MPKDTNANAGGEKPTAGGRTTMQEREARAANEQPLSPQNDAAMPSLGDLAEFLPSARRIIGAASDGEDDDEATEPADTAPDDADGEEPAGEGEEDAEPTDEATDETDSADDGGADGEAETDDDDEEEADEAPAKGKSWPDSAKKRVGKLTAQKKAAEERAAAAETELAQLRAQSASANAGGGAAAPGPGAGPLDHVTTPEQLQTAVTQAQQMEAWAIENAEGGEAGADAQGNAIYIDAAGARKMQAQARRILSAAPGRAQFLQTQHAATEEARKVYPNLFTPGTREATIFGETLKAYPEMRRMPGFAIVIGDAIAGMEARTKKAAAPAGGGGKPSKPAAAAPKKPAPVITTPKAAPRQPAKADKSQALGKLVKSGSSRDALENFAATLVA